MSHQQRYTDTHASQSFLQKNMQRINAEFDSGKLRAFGDAQEDVLKQFQRVRQMQVALSLKQVAMLGDEKEHSERDIDELTRRLSEIAAEMEALMSNRTEKKSDSKRVATAATASAAGEQHDDDDDDDDEEEDEEDAS